MNAEQIQRIEECKKILKEERNRTLRELSYLNKLIPNVRTDITNLKKALQEKEEYLKGIDEYDAEAYVINTEIRVINVKINKYERKIAKETNSLKECLVDKKEIEEHIEFTNKFSFEVSYNNKRSLSDFDVSYLFKNIEIYKESDISVDTNTVNNITYKQDLAFNTIITSKDINNYEREGIVNIGNLGDIHLKYGHYGGNLSSKSILDDKIYVENETIFTLLKDFLNKNRTGPSISLNSFFYKKGDYETKFIKPLKTILLRSYAKHLKLTSLEIYSSYLIPFETLRGKTCSLPLFPDSFLLKEGNIIGITQFTTNNEDEYNTFKLLNYCLAARLIGIKLEFADIVFYNIATNKLVVTRYNNEEIILETNIIANSIVEILDMEDKVIL